MSYELRFAEMKLERALIFAEDDMGPFDPVSGYSLPEIVRWLLDNGGEHIVRKHGVTDLASVSY